MSTAPSTEQDRTANRKPRDGHVGGRAERRTVIVIAATAVVAVLTAMAGFALGHHTSTKPHTAAAGAPGIVDVGFAQDMAAHHDQAVLMANLAITRGGPAVQGIADSILTNQAQETGQLRGWLQLWNKPIADSHPMYWMPPSAMGSAGDSATPGTSGGTSMPGMASPTEMATLYSRRGRSFDVLFLQLMIRHHEGGIEMAHYAETHAHLAAVRTAATAMRVEQVQDLAQMRPLLQGDGAKELPAP